MKKETLRADFDQQLPVFRINRNHGIVKVLTPDPIEIEVSVETDFLTFRRNLEGCSIEECFLMSSFLSGSNSLMML